MSLPAKRLPFIFKGNVSVTDELFDAYVSRPLASYIVRAVQFTRITPNHLTLISMTFGILSATFLLYHHRYAPFIAGICLVISMIFDCSDGQLARVRGGGSLLGRIYDGYADYITGISIHLALMSALMPLPFTIWGYSPDSTARILLVVFAGISTSLNAGRFDFYKQRYLANTDPSREAEKPEMYLKEAESAATRFQRISLKLFAGYLKAQQGSATEQIAANATRIAKNPKLREEFKKRNGIWLRLWSFTGPTMHNFLLSIAAIITPLVPQALIWYCITIIVPVNIYCLLVILAQKKWNPLE